LVVRQPHSEHWNAWAADDFAMGRTVLAGSDSEPPRLASPVRRAVSATARRGA
jgi:hypothetical protein